MTVKRRTRGVERLETSFEVTPVLTRLANCKRVTKCFELVLRSSVQGNLNSAEMREWRKLCHAVQIMLDVPVAAL